MRDSVQGVLQFQFYQVPMTGPDACGFGLAASEELASRWMQLSAFYPFYRNHNADSGGDQYPYLWPGVAEASRKVIKARYALLPYWESLFKSVNTDGTPPLRPLFFEFARQELLSEGDKQFMVGPSLLVTPVLQEGATKVKGYFPSENGTQWRNWWTHEVVVPDSNDVAELDAPLGEIPVHVRSGSVLLVYNEPKYTLKETREGSMGVVIHLNADGEAQGVFHLDDGMSDDGQWCKLHMADIAVGSSCTVEIRVTQNKIAFLSSGDYTVPSCNALTSIKLLNVERRPVAVQSESGECRVEQWEGKTGTAWLGGVKIELNQGGVISWA